MVIECQGSVSEVMMGMLREPEYLNTMRTSFLNNYILTYATLNLCGPFYVVLFLKFIFPSLELLASGFVPVLYC